MENWGGVENNQIPFATVYRQGWIILSWTSPDHACRLGAFCITTIRYLLNSVKGRNEEQSMIATYRYILRKNSQFKGLPQLEKSLFLKVLRGLLRSESRLLELMIIKECGDQARLLKKWTVKTMREVMPCRVCLQLPKLSIASEYYYCCSCKILFKTCVSFWKTLLTTSFYQKARKGERERASARTTKVK